ncbi:hypothetical protein [Paramicrobacterium agarici]|uniref:hypothetical protein n=1 Tax=Paramicrobacterium agarici TaxID=630514 RepID=UPI0011513D07|nr:hypothetical protein [Microbacterium agarici]TQO24280.1 hypothetical protein FB385_3160 [Microbacterium agarici]
MFIGDSSSRIGISPFTAMVKDWEIGDRVLVEVTAPALGEACIAACGVREVLSSADILSPRFITQLNAFYESEPIRFLEPIIGGIAIEKTRELNPSEIAEVTRPRTDVDALLARQPEPLTMLAA